MERKRKILIAAALLFLLLFAAKFVHELSRPERGFGGVAYSALRDVQEVSLKNYASAKVAVEQAAAGPQFVEQKYERVSVIESKTERWDTDMAALKLAVEGSGALVQRENAFGLEGSRVLSLSLGVVPDAFDPTVETLKSIGALVSANVTKTDRTSDYRALEARRLSLEKTRDGLKSLRSAGAQLADRIDLETRILEIEGQIQELGVSLGDFSELNSFCTIHFTLKEVPPRNTGERLLAAALAALGWTVPVYLGIALSVLAALGTASLAVRLADRWREAGKRPPPGRANTDGDGKAPRDAL